MRKKNNFPSEAEMEILEFEAEVLMMSGDPSIDEGEGGDPFGF